MAKPDLGDKRQCQNCGTKFFDLNKSPIVCPKCGTVFEVAAAPTRSASRATAKQDDDEEVETEQDAEVVSLEDADQVDDGKVTASNPDDDADSDDEDDNTSNDDDDTFLEDDDEDDGDVSGLVDNERDEDEER